MKRIITQLLDLIFPRSIDVRRLEAMTAQEALRVLPHCGIQRDKMYALFAYQNKMIKVLVWEIKYRGSVMLARLCAECLWTKFFHPLSRVATFRRLSRPLFVPIPLSPRRRRERGFNQNELVLRGLAAIDLGNASGVAGARKFDFAFDALCKVRDTVPQSSLKNRAERLTNLAGCFSVAKPELVRGRDIVLFDDVLTTGSTLREARDALLRVGARSVQAITIAH